MTKKVGRIRDVAKETGLSIATISRVMNGATSVKPATRDIVLAACEKLDYVPNPAARSLSTNRSKTIAVIIPTIEHSVFDKYIAGIEQLLSERGYSLVLAVSNSNHDEELAAAQKLLGMGAEAFVLTGTEHSQALIDMFQRRHVPYAFTSVWEPELASPTIGYDNRTLAKQAIEFLVTKGHRQIAVVHGPLAESDRTRSRYNGAMDAATPQLALQFFETALSVEGGKGAIGSLLASKSKCTAILCFSDVIALGAYFALFEAKLRIPDDISVMGFDNLDWSKHATPSLTTIDLPARKMGLSVVEQLINNLEKSVPVVRQLLPAAIIERQSVHSIKH